MKFKVNRNILLEYLKSMEKIVQKDSPIEELRGFLVEANEDDGHLYLTANNLKTAVIRKLEAGIESGGSFVMNARRLIHIVSVAGCEDMVFEEVKKGVIRITAGTCTYRLPILDSAKYPRTEIPFPDSTVSMCGLKQLYLKTCSSVGKGSDNEALKGIHVDIENDGFRAISCNGQNIALASKEITCGGKLGFTVSKHDFFNLAYTAGDDDVQVGISGPHIVFMKKGMLFSMKTLNQRFIDADMILRAIKTAYMSAVDFDVFKEALVSTCDIAGAGIGKAYVKLDFEDNKISMSAKSSISRGNNEAEAVLIEGKSGMSFYYPAAQLRDIFRTVEGRFLIELDNRGYLLARDRYNKFMLTPVDKATVERQLEKSIEKQTKPKTLKQEDEKQNAA